MVRPRPLSRITALSFSIKGTGFGQVEPPGGGIALFSRRRARPPVVVGLDRIDVPAAQLAPESAKLTGGTETEPGNGSIAGPSGGDQVAPPPSLKSPPTRFYGSVEIDMLRPVKAFDAILNAVVMELQRTQGAKVKLTLEIEAETPQGFSESDIGVIRDNAQQLKFKAESTGFGD
jgi:hypothetical protein